MTVVLALGFLALAAAALLALAFPRAGALAGAAGCGLLAAAGAGAAAGGWAPRLDIGGWLGFGQAALVDDRLAGIFLAVTGATGLCVSLAHARSGARRGLVFLHDLLMLALATVLTVDQGFVFLLAWEVVTLTILLIAGLDRERPGALAAAYFTGTVTKLGGGALLAAFALLYAHSGSFRFAAWAQAAGSLHGGVATAVFVLLLVGFGTKLGLVPFQGPIPLAYWAAPGAGAASLSIALNAGFYGLWRFLVDLLGAHALWQGELVMTLGAFGALVGILYAIGQDDVKRFLGFSSVEHAGIVLIGLGVALIGQAAGLPLLTGAGLLAATMHLVMHGLAKSLAFLAADELGRATGTQALAPLGGLVRSMPATAAAFGVAALSLAAMPPLGGFVSEWLTLEALLQAFRLGDTLARLLMALAGALLSLTAGLALLAFAKLYGTVFLGRPRSPRRVAGTGRRLRPGAALLGLSLLGLGAVAPWEVRWIGSGLHGVIGFDLARTALSHPLVLGPVFPGFSVLAPTWLTLALPAFGLATLVAVLVLARRPVRVAPIWASGTLTRSAETQYTPAGYSNPVRVVLRVPFGFQRRVVGSAGRGRPDGAPLRVETRQVPLFEHYLYRPVSAWALRLADAARRLQSGRLSHYLLYLLAVLIAVLALIPSLKD